MQTDYNYRLGDRYALRIKDAAAYFSIGENKIRQIVKENPELCITSGNRTLIKRKLFEEFLDKAECV
jgi:hypothetical protein